MKTFNSKIILSVVIFLGLGGGWYLITHFSLNSYENSLIGEGENLSYYCPMHPNIRSEEPGQCSICGMNLVPVDVSGHSNHDHSHVEKENKGSEHSHPKNHTVVKLRLDKEQVIGVKLGRAEKRNLFKEIRAPGRIAFDPELYTAQSEYLEAIKQWRKVKNSPLEEVKRNTQEMIRSSKIRLRILGLSEDQIIAVSKRGKLSESLLVTGKDKNWVYADVFEMDLPYIEEGLSAEISANFLQGRKLAAKVISVDEVINSQTRTAKVRLQLVNRKESIRPQSYVNVKVLIPLGEHLAVPIESLMDTGREVYVFVKRGKGEYEPREVRVTLETHRYAAISNGILEGEEIVVGGNFMLDSESRLQAVIKNVQDSGH